MSQQKSHTICSPENTLQKIQHHHLNIPSSVRNPVFFQKASTGFSWNKRTGDISSPRTSTDFFLKTPQISEQFWLSKHLPYKGDFCGYLKAEQTPIVTQSAQPIELEKHIYAPNKWNLNLHLTSLNLLGAI